MCEKVSMHFVQLECDLRKRTRALSLLLFRNRGTIFLRVSGNETAAQTSDATNLPPTRVGQRRHFPFVYPPCRLSCQSRNSVTDPSPSSSSSSSSTTYMSFRGPRETLQSSLIPWMLPRPSPFLPHSPPLYLSADVVCFRRTWRDYEADARRFFATISSVRSLRVSRWTLSRTIVQLPAEIISGRA